MITSQVRFPSEIQADKVFLGNLIQGTCSTIINLLGIKTVISLTPHPIDEYLKPECPFKYHNFDFNEAHKPEIPFSEILELIDSE